MILILFIFYNFYEQKKKKEITQKIKKITFFKFIKNNRFIFNCPSLLPPPSLSSAHSVGAHILRFIYFSSTLVGLFLI